MIRAVVAVALALGVGVVAFPSVPAAVAALGVCALAAALYALDGHDARSQRLDVAAKAEIAALRAALDGQAAEMKTLTDTVGRHSLLIKR